MNKKCSKNCQFLLTFNFYFLFVYHQPIELLNDKVTTNHCEMNDNFSGMS